MSGNKSNKTKNVKQTPWEPYKGATTKLDLFIDGYNLNTTLNQDNLIRYKTDTNLVEFNQNRSNSESNDLDIVGDFKDARFYTDHHFLKLATQLKDKLQSNVSSTLKPIDSFDSLSVVNDNGLNLRNDVTSPVSASIYKLQRQQYEDRIKYLEEQIKGFYEQLELQTQINAELKKLLVASIGDDIQYKIERLINDKQRFEYELTNNNKRLTTMSEELEQISIQCDLWRTKYIATKSMCDELNLWKQFLLFLQHEYNLIIRNILNENQTNTKNINDILNNLSLYKEQISQTSTDSEFINNHTRSQNQAIELLSKLTNDLLSVNNSDDQKKFKTTKNIDYLIDLSKNEFIAKQMITQFSWLPLSNLNTIDSIEIMLNTLKAQKLQVMERYNDVNFVCCSKCKGTVQVI